MQGFTSRTGTLRGDRATLLSVVCRPTPSRLCVNLTGRGDAVACLSPEVHRHKRVECFPLKRSPTATRHNVITNGCEAARLFRAAEAWVASNSSQRKVMGGRS
jgi:hypothetical protein